MTKDEELQKLQEAIMLLGEVYQSLSHAPALALAWDSELKKIPRM